MYNSGEQKIDVPKRVKEKLIALPFSIVAVLPLGFVRWCGKTLGAAAYFFNIELVKVTRKNLALCYPDKSEENRERLCKASISHTFMFGLETCLVWKRGKVWLERYIDCLDDSLLRSAVEEKQGVIILAPHIGNWEVLGRKLPEIGPIVNLYAPPKNQLLEGFIKSNRESNGATLVPTNSRGVAKILKHLKAGGLTGILPDQVPPKVSGEYSEFFGLTALTMTLVHGLLARTNCRVLIGAALRSEHGFIIKFVEPDKRIFSEDLETSLLGLNKSVENIISDAPEQYQWEYKRFKRQPSKTTSHYDF